MLLVAGGNRLSTAIEYLTQSTWSHAALYVGNAIVAPACAVVVSAGSDPWAMREFLLGQEALKRFIAREPLRRVHEAVFAVLALESEPVDPRL